MDGILNKIINLDNQAKNKIIQIKQKEENIETYISETIEKEKKEIDSRFLYKINIEVSTLTTQISENEQKLSNAQEKYDKMFEESKKKLDEEKDKQINKIREKYEQEKQQIIEKMLSEIV